MEYKDFIQQYCNENIHIFQADCMDMMRSMPDKCMDLALVDPSYGISINNQSQGKGGGVAKKIEYTKKDWDSAIPDKEYFVELMRVSKNQIIWGGNYFVENLTNSSCWVVWDKVNGTTDFADCELAWTSFKTSIRKIEWKWAGMMQQDMKNKEKRIHPTQKPVKLYEWLLKHYAKENDKIIDTHLGSGSIAIAIDKANTLDKKNLTFVGMEIDEDYYNGAVNRFKNYKLQKTLF